MVQPLPVMAKLMMAIGTMAQSSAPAAPTLVIRGALVWTANDQQPQAGVVVISGERIVAVGDEALLTGLDLSSARVIDAGGRRLLPGLIDSHVHLIGGGLGLTQLQLREAGSREDFIQRINEWVVDHPSADLKSWVLGRGWSVESWPVEQQPTRQWIDTVTGDRPAYLIRMDGHCALANSAALKMAGITHETTDPPGGQIIRDEQTGEPTGLLTDAAMELVSRHIPKPNPETRLAAAKAAMRLFNQQGVTTVHDMSNPEDIVELYTLAGEGTLRVMTYMQSENWIQGPRPSGPDATCKVGEPTGFWSWLGCKGYIDGSLGAKTAYMREPFSDNSEGEMHNRGILMPFAEAVRAEGIPGLPEQLRFAAEHRLQPTLHAIGDEANHLVLDQYEQIFKATNIRPRIEHVQHLLAEDIARFAQIGVVASMQPLHKADDGRYALERLGAKRCRTSYAFRSLLESGVVVCFGSDWPVVSNNPFEGMKAAVTGLTLEEKVFVPEQNISIEQALRCYTCNAAYACFRERELGQIQPGYLADLIIVDRDPLTIPPEQLSTVGVDVTIFNGRVVWNRNSE